MITGKKKSQGDFLRFLFDLSVGSLLWFFFSHAQAKSLAMFELLVHLPVLFIGILHISLKEIRILRIWQCAKHSGSLQDSKCPSHTVRSIRLTSFQFFVLIFFLFFFASWCASERSGRYHNANSRSDFGSEHHRWRCAHERNQRRWETSRNDWCRTRQRSTMPSARRSEHGLRFGNRVRCRTSTESNKSIR